MQAQIQVLLATREEEEATEESNTGFNIEVAKPLVFSKEAEKME